MRDLFQVVFELKKQEMEKKKQRIADDQLRKTGAAASARVRQPSPAISGFTADSVTVGGIKSDVITVKYRCFCLGLVGRGLSFSVALASGVMSGFRLHPEAYLVPTPPPPTPHCDCVSHPLPISWAPLRRTWYAMCNDTAAPVMVSHVP